MKKLILTIIFLFASFNICAQIGNPSGGNNPHDSLLFDGAREVFMNKGGDKNCGWKVKHVWGTVIGTRDTAIRYEPNECDDMKEEFVRDVVSQVRSPLKEGDEIYDNDNLEMKGEAFIQLEMGYPKINTSETRLPENYPGFLIITVKCKNFKVPNCGPDTRWDYRNGGAPVWWEMKTLEKKYGPKFLFNANKSYSIQTDQCIIKNNGTIYSLEQTETDDIIRVYEGSVEITQIHGDTSNLSGVMKLQEDYKNGKISTEEMV